MSEWRKHYSSIEMVTTEDTSLGRSGDFVFKDKIWGGPN